MDEASGDAAVRVDPERPEAIADGIRAAVGDTAELRAKGLAHAKTFSWRHVGELFVEGYERFA